MPISVGARARSGQSHFLLDRYAYAYPSAAALSRPVRVPVPSWAIGSEIRLLVAIIGRPCDVWWYCQRDESTHMHIRPIEDRDVPAVAALLAALARQFIVHESTPHGAATFLRENDAESIRRYIAAGMLYHVAQVDGVIAGFVAVRAPASVPHVRRRCVAAPRHRTTIVGRGAPGGARGGRRRPVYRQRVQFCGAGVPRTGLCPDSADAVHERLAVQSDGPLSFAASNRIVNMPGPGACHAARARAASRSGAPRYDRTLLLPINQKKGTS